MTFENFRQCKLSTKHFGYWTTLEQRKSMTVNQIRQEQTKQTRTYEMKLACTDCFLTSKFKFIRKKLIWFGGADLSFKIVRVVPSTGHSMTKIVKLFVRMLHMYLYALVCLCPISVCIGDDISKPDPSERRTNVSFD